jgi:hypothetical protein
MIASLVQPDLEDMRGIMTLASKPFRHTRRKIGIDKEAHQTPLRRRHLVPGEPCGVGKGLADVYPLEIRVVGEDLVDGRTLSDQVRNGRNRRMPRMQARPPIASGSKVMRSKTILTRSRGCRRHGHLHSSTTTRFRRPGPAADATYHM